MDNLATKVLPLAISGAIIKHFGWSGFAIFVLSYMTLLWLMINKMKP
ncbi:MULTISPECIES: hypothetical protein [unclassified Streptococcus]